MRTLITFIGRYLISAAASLVLIFAGWLPKYRAALYEAAYQLGWRQRPAPIRSEPELKIPRGKASDVIEQDAPFKILEPDAADGNVSGYELMVIAGIIHKQKPGACFEIGTFDGRTSLNLAANMPESGRVYTLDLPPDEVSKTSLNIAQGDDKFIVKSESGARFKASSYGEKITQLWGDSASFDYTPYLGKMDVVFVDGAHSYEYVKKDTETALKLLKPNRGVIMWHDYSSPYWKGLTRAMNELYEEKSELSGMRHIAGTTLVVWDRSVHR